MSEEDLEFQPTKEDLDHLRQWIAKSPHIVQDYDDQVLSAFIRGRKGRLQKAKETLEAVNSVGQRCPHLIKSYDPMAEVLVEHLAEVPTFALPKKTPDGSTVFFCFFRHDEGFKSNPYNGHAPEFYRYWLLSVYTSIWTNDFGNGKWIVVSDCKAMNILHSRELTPALLKQGIDMMQSALPIRIQGIHMINVPPFLEYMLNLAKKLMKKKVAERFHFHSNMESFYEMVPKEILPKEYGGTEESGLICNERWYETVKSFRKRFLEEEAKMRKLDPLRPKNDEAQDMVGTFKTLNVD